MCDFILGSSWTVTYDVTSLRFVACLSRAGREISKYAPWATPCLTPHHGLVHLCAIVLKLTGHDLLWFYLILCLIPRMTVTSLIASKNTRCKTHPSCVNLCVPFWTREKTCTRSRGETKYRVCRLFIFSKPKSSHANLLFSIRLMSMSRSCRLDFVIA